MHIKPARVALFTAVFTLLALATATRATGEAPSYTKEQATRGEAAYGEHCASCHGRSLQGTHISPPLSGQRFDQSWRGKSTNVLAYHVRRMPPPQPGQKMVALDDATYADVLAYVLQFNGFEAGADPLPSADADLKKTSLPKLPGADVDIDAPVKPSRRQAARLAALPTVTQEMLNHPAPHNWLHWGRTSDGTNASPLKVVNKDNVKDLKPAWRAQLRDGVSMAVPVVLEGIMFLHSYPDTVLAMDATNGNILWRYQHKSALGSSQKLGVSLGGDKVLVPTSDIHVLALEAKTGKLLWDHKIDTPSDYKGPGGYQLRSTPLVANGLVIQGVTSSFVPKGGVIVAIDLETGKEAWRFNTIARPGEHGGESWNGVPLEKRSGGSVWHQGTFDPETGLVYFGVAPTYDTGPLLHPSGIEGTTSEALYTNCTIALDVKTGELVWYYQHMPNDQWDLDWAFERQIVDMEYKGEMRRVVMNVGKIAMLEALDAKTGEYLFTVDPGTQNIISAVDKKTGEKTYDPARMPDPSKDTLVCPTASGARAWPPTSYSTDTGFAYLPLTEWCMTLGPGGAQLLTSGVGIKSGDHPDAEDGKLGRLQAIDVAYQELAWRHDQEAPLSTGVLATAGGLLFAGDVEPSIKAFDQKTGELLWRAGLDAPPTSSIISYGVGERQFVAVLVGAGNLHVGPLMGAYQRLLQKSGKKLELPPKSGTTLWVFSL